MSDEVDTPLESEDYITAVHQQAGLSDPTDTSTVSKDSLEAVAGYPRLKGYFGIASPTPEDKLALKDIWNYFGKDAKTLGEVVAGVRRLEDKLASAPLGQNRLQYIASYLRVMKDVEDINQEKSAYESRD